VPPPPPWLRYCLIRVFSEHATRQQQNAYCSTWDHDVFKQQHQRYSMKWESQFCECDASRDAESLFFFVWNSRLRLQG